MNIVHKDLNFPVPVHEGVFWSEKQRDCHSIHEISYRACFKPALPRFFIEHLTEPGDVVYDPFAGRGTTLIESFLLKRYAIGADVNPVSKYFIEPRMDGNITLNDIERYLNLFELRKKVDIDERLLVFFHRDTLIELTNLREHFLRSGGNFCSAAWIRMIVLNRLTGHSKGFFSVYTLPPNQAVSIESQKKINEKKNQVPEYRNVKELILKKAKALLRDSCKDGYLGCSHSFYEKSCIDTPEIEDGRVNLVVTSPPFIDVVDYAQDNWLRCWFLGIDHKEVPFSIYKTPEGWSEHLILPVLKELKRVLHKTGYIAFEVGEVHKGKLQLENWVIDAAIKAGLEVEAVMINRHAFTKTANLWKVDNNQKGTNSNRVVIMRKNHGMYGG